MVEKAFMAPNPVTPTPAIFIDPAVCTGCNECVNICRTQTLLPNPDKGKPPVAQYPDECWFCSCCVEACPNKAIIMRYPINQRLFFKRKDTGEIFRIGYKNAPERTYFEPPIG